MGVEGQGGGDLPASLTPQHYWIADQPGSTIEFQFDTVIGTVDLFYQRSEKYNLGNLACWIDADRHLAKILKGYWTVVYSIGQ